MTLEGLVLLRRPSLLLFWHGKRNLVPLGEQSA